MEEAKRIKLIIYTSLNISQDFQEHCIEIFKSNSPIFFDPEELQLFEYYLISDVEKHRNILLDHMKS